MTRKPVAARPLHALPGLLLLLSAVSTLGGCGAPLDAADEALADKAASDDKTPVGQKTAALSAPAGMGRYCSVTWPNGGWAFTSFTNLTSDPCAAINPGPSGGTVKRAGMYAANALNNVVVRCGADQGWVNLYVGVGNGPLTAAYNAAQGRSGCIFTASPRDMPIFNSPFPAGTAVTPVTGVDFARGPYNTLNLAADYGQPGASTAATKVDWKARDKSTTGFIDDHDGWDLNVATGTPIRAVADGVVMAARFRDVSVACPNAPIKSQGEVFIKHTVSGGSGTSLYDEYFITFYAHFSSINVAAGATVTKGQQIGLAGTSGCSSGPHLHLGTFRQTNTASQFVYPFVINSNFAAGQDQNSANGYQIMTDPHGFSPAVGFDPWAWRAYPFGALSVNLWSPNQAPPTGSW